MRRLAEREVNELLVECGPTLAGGLIAHRLVDELLLYVAPKLLGDDAAPLMYLKKSGFLPEFEFRDVQRIGRDVRLILDPKNS